jgi:transmembrane sensor
MIDSDDQEEASDPREDEAFEWLMLLTSGEATTSDLQALERWRGQSTLNEAAFAQAGKLWRSVGPAVGAASRQIRAVPSARPLSRLNSPVARRAVFGGALAASAAYLVMRPPLGLWPSLSELTSDYRTGIGEQRRITTANGDTLELNTRTSVDIRSAADGVARIELISGEATITTATNRSTPVVAIAAGGRAIATDATFNMRCGAASVDVTCLAGTVQVEQRGQIVTVQEGQQVSYTESGLGEAVTVDPAGVTAWRNGALVFHNVPLTNVIEEVNRYRPGRILIVDGRLGRRLVTARFKLDRLSEVITEVQEVFGASVTRLPGEIILLRS